jgi:WD40 repeat protein
MLNWICYSTFEINSAINTVDNQQVGNLWKGDYLVTASLSGEFSYLDKNSGKVSRHIDGHSKAITALSVTEDDTFFTGSYDGRVFGWKYGAEGDHTTAERVEGDGHKNQVTALSSKNNDLVSAAMDDTIRRGIVGDCKFSDKIISTGSLPSSLSVSNDKTTVVSTNETVLVYNDKLEKIGQLENPGFTPSTVEISPDSKYVYVGGHVRIKIIIEPPHIEKFTLYLK